MGPTVEGVTEYLGDTNASAEEIQRAFDTECAAQSRVCRLPADAEDTPDDLVEALYRRVARNLKTRDNPLGFQESISIDGGGFRIPWRDAEITRLESPWRKWVVG